MQSLDASSDGIEGVEGSWHFERSEWKPRSDMGFSTAGKWDVPYQEEYGKWFCMQLSEQSGISMPLECKLKKAPRRLCMQEASALERRVYSSSLHSDPIISLTISPVTQHYSHHSKTWLFPWRSNH